MMRALRCLTVTLVTATALGACATSQASPTETSSTVDATPLSELTPPEDPRTYEGPSTAALLHHEVTPVAENPRQALPATVVSHDRGGDVDVVVKDTSRVVAINMSGSIAATVWGLGFGDSLVGRDVSTKIPGTAKLPVVTGSGHSINAETVLALDPSLVITDGTIGPRDVVEQLRDAGVKVVFVKNDPSFEGAAVLARDVAAIFGVPDTGEKLAGQITGQITSTKADIARLVPRDKHDRVSMIFLYLRGASGVYYLFGRESGASDLIDGLGGIDVASKMGWTGMRPMTDEAMLKADPDLILVMTDGIKSTGGVDGLLKEKSAIEMTAAGQHRRFVDMADGDILSFGPRSADVLAALARAVYAPDQT